MKKLYLNRLRKLANHLINGKLAHKRFNFSVYNTDFNVLSKDKCGTAGCAIGECPAVWPKHWEWTFGGVKLLRNEVGTSSENSGVEWFGLDCEQYGHLFKPNCQKPEYYRGTILSENATKEEVANNILEFIKLQEESKLKRKCHNRIKTKKIRT